MLVVCKTVIVQNIDNTSERTVQDALDRAKEGRTTILIAHRLSTIRNADLIIGLERGQVVEYGAHDELMERKGLYYELVTAQTKKETEKEEIELEDGQEKDDTSSKRSLNQEHVTCEYFIISYQYTTTVFVIGNRKVSIQSIRSVFSADKYGEEGNVTPANDLLKRRRKTFFRIPFVFKILKHNASEWPWILTGVVCSLLFGTIQPVLGLFISQIYG